jgi:hypothetical protein
VQPANRDALAAKQIAQHPAAGERIGHVHLVDPPHDGEVARRYRSRQVIGAASADPELLRLPRHRQRV